MGILAVRSGRKFLRRTGFIVVFICRTHSTSEGWLWRQQIRGQSETRGNMSAHSAIRRTAASRVYPTWGSFGRAKVTRHNSRVHSAAGKLAVAGNGHGVIVGCLQQYRKRWGFVRLAISRAAWPHALHGKQQQHQQREKSRRDQVCVFRQPPLFWSGNITGRGGQVWSSLVGFSNEG